MMKLHKSALRSVWVLFALATTATANALMAQSNGKELQIGATQLSGEGDLGSLQKSFGSIPVGWDIQARSNLGGGQGSRWSLGGGYMSLPLIKGTYREGLQYVTADLKSTFWFVDLRYTAVTVGRVALYSSARAGSGKFSGSYDSSVGLSGQEESKRFTGWGGGVGALIALAGDLRVDLGAQYLALGNDGKADMKGLNYRVGLNWVYER